MSEERLQKILSRAGVASRRKAENIIVEGRVAVNGKVITELGSKADLERDHIKEPSPRVLWAIAECYGADYLDLMRRAGHPMPSASHVIFAGAERLSPDERDEVQEFIVMKLRRRRDRWHEADTRA